MNRIEEWLGGVKRYYDLNSNVWVSRVVGFISDVHLRVDYMTSKNARLVAQLKLHSAASATAIDPSWARSQTNVIIQFFVGISAAQSAEVYVCKCILNSVTSIPEPGAIWYFCGVEPDRRLDIAVVSDVRMQLGCELRW